LYDANGYNIPSEAEAVDVKSAAVGMIKIFQAKSYQLPSTHAIRAFKSLVTHLESHYRKPTVFEKCHVVRSLVN
jgi:tuberous sclerosis 2